MAGICKHHSVIVNAHLNEQEYSNRPMKAQLEQRVISKVRNQNTRLNERDAL
jgi:hypothetical protein